MKHANHEPLDHECAPELEDAGAAFDLYDDLFPAPTCESLPL